jgi:hypothetical protein
MQKLMQKAKKKIYKNGWAVDNDFATSGTTQTTKNKLESKEHLYQRMVIHAEKLDIDHIKSLAQHHLRTDTVVSSQFSTHGQQTAAEIIRACVEYEYYSLFELPHNVCTATHVQGSMFLYSTTSAPLPMCTDPCITNRSWLRITG